MAETEEKGARFIAHLLPIEQFDAKLAELREVHRKASHHVTAFRQINEYDHINELGKDDGEPAGTSGMPVLKTLIGAELVNIGMIVTRYFGGTKLGTGGLARAYSGASNAAIDMAILVTWERIITHRLNSSFAQSSEIERQISIAGLKVLDRQFYEDGVIFEVEGLQTNIQQFKEALTR